jgi:poly(A) polymerase
MLFSRNKVVVRNRDAHNISRQHIDPDALRVLYRLADSGYTAYLVGGSVRDLLMGRQPKDFDVSTDAHPGQIRKLFRNCFLVGKRFRLAHIVFGRKVIETSTFRKPPQADAADEGVPGGLYQHEDNTFGTPEEDARRRDFTVNGLFYDIRTFSVIDYVGGLRDLESRTLRSIGDPNIRFREDPVRMMRAVRFAARLDFSMDWSCRRALRRHAAEITNASVPRLVEEVMRLFGHNCSAAAFRLLWEYRLMAVLLPEIHEYVERSKGSRSPLWRHLAAFDADPVHATASNGLRMAVLHAPLYAARLGQQTVPADDSSGYALAQEILDPIAKRLSLPKQVYFTACMLLDGQRRIEPGTRPHRRARMARHHLFPEALALRRIVLTATDQDLSPLREWEMLTAPASLATAHGQPAEGGATTVPGDTAADAVPEDQAPHRRRRRRGGRRRRDNTDADRPHPPPPAARGERAETPAVVPAASPPAGVPHGDSDLPADAG